jgi:hypothetical protein
LSERIEKATRIADMQGSKGYKLLTPADVLQLRQIAFEGMHGIMPKLIRKTGWQEWSRQYSVAADAGEEE